jgi:hypothetical protein
MQFVHRRAVSALRTIAAEGSRARVSFITALQDEHPSY